MYFLDEKLRKKKLFFYLSWSDAKMGGLEIKMMEYIYGYYFSTITMSSVGYGDIVPVNTFEVFLSIIFTFISCGVFAFTINKSGSILEGLSRRGKQKEELITSVN